MTTIDLTAESTELTLDQRGDLRELEQVIERGQRTFIEVGSALQDIRDEYLYRETHETFEAYLSARWPEIGKRRAYQLMDAAQVAQKVNPGTQTPITNERQARPLAKLEPDQAREAWEAATTAYGDNPTGEQVKRATLRYKPAPADFAMWVARAKAIHMELGYSNGEFDIFVDGERSCSAQWNVVKQLVSQYEDDAKLFTIRQMHADRRWVAELFDGSTTESAYTSGQARGLGRALVHRMRVAALNAAAPSTTIAPTQPITLPTAQNGAGEVTREIIESYQTRILQATDRVKLRQLCVELLMLLDGEV